MTLKARLDSGELLLGDGAMGTMLQAAGLLPGACPELWCLEQADAVRAVHRAYCEAGSHLVETNSFGGNAYKLSHFELGNRVAEINQAAASLAREVAGTDRYVLGSMGPIGVFMEPLGTATEAEMLEAFRVQAEALAAGGADAVIVETMTALEEAATAVRAVRQYTDLPVGVSFTFDPQADGGYASMMGVRPDVFARAAREWGVDLIGSNCGTGPDVMVDIVSALHAAVPELPILAMPNAGMPVFENGETVFKATPRIMADQVAALVDAGARIVAGCCGTTPAHIRAMRAALDGLSRSA